MYFLVEHPWQGLVKIGKAKDAAAGSKAAYPAPWNRIVSEVAGNPRMLVLWWAIGAEDPDALERSLHFVLAPRQVSCGGGVEWYALTLGELEALRHVVSRRPFDGARAELDIFDAAARAVAASDALARVAGAAAAGGVSAAATAARAVSAAASAASASVVADGAASTAPDAAIDAVSGIAAGRSCPRLLHFSEAMREHGSEARLVHIAAVQQHVTDIAYRPQDGFYATALQMTNADEPDEPEEEEAE